LMAMKITAVTGITHVGPSAIIVDLVQSAHVMRPVIN